MAPNRHWVGTWTTAPAPSVTGEGFNNHTLRMNPRISIGGDTLRIRVSNAYGAGKLDIGAAYVGIRDKGPAIAPGSERQLTFGGSESTTVAAGALVVSDAVQLEVQPLADLAVSLVATLGRDGAIKACQENCWEGVLDHVLTPKKDGSGS